MPGVLLFILIIVPTFCFIAIMVPEYTVNAKARNIVKNYRSGNIYPIMKYAQKNHRFYDCSTTDATIDERFDITLLINILRTKIPAKYKTLDQKKAYLIATNYDDLNHSHSYHDLGRIGDAKYAKVSDNVLTTILNDEDLMSRFASKYYREKREDVGRYNCIRNFDYDDNEIAGKILEKARTMWDEYHKENGGNQ